MQFSSTEHSAVDEKSLLNKVQIAPSMNGQDLVKEVTCSKPYIWQSFQTSKNIKRATTIEKMKILQKSLTQVATKEKKVKAKPDESKAKKPEEKKVEKK